MKYRVLKPLPDGDQPGDTVEIDNEEIAKVFLLVEAIEPLPEPKPVPRGRYRRTDLKAEHSEDLAAIE